MKQIVRILLLFGIVGVVTLMIEGQPRAADENTIGQSWIDGWNSTDPEKLVAAFTPDGVYEDVAFGIIKKGSAELRDLHKFFHNAVGGLYVKLVDTHVSNGHGTIEWIFGGTDIDVFKTGKPLPSEGSVSSTSRMDESHATSTITMRLQ